MSTSKTTIFLLISVLYFTNNVESTPNSTPSNFIKTQCSTTQYPTICIQSLSSYASAIQESPKKLAETALSVSVARAKFAKGFVVTIGKFRGLKRREYEAVKDCIEEMEDSVDRLSKSVSEMNRVGNGNGQNMQWHISNIQTWISAALTDENTCMDEFDGKVFDGKIKASVRAWVVNVAHVTSNALALVNRFASKV